MSNLHMECNIYCYFKVYKSSIPIMTIYIYYTYYIVYVYYNLLTMENYEFPGLYRYL